MAEQDDTERTEEPTSKKIEDALKKGQVAFSREVVSFAFFAYFSMLIIWIIPSLSKSNVLSLDRYLLKAHDISISISNIKDVVYGIVIIFGKIIFLPLAMAFVFAIFASTAQNGLNFSAEPLMPKLEKISPMAGFKRIFSVKSLVEFAKGILKIAVIAYISYKVVEGFIPTIIAMTDISIREVSNELALITFKIVLYCTIFMMMVAILDFAYQRFELMKNLRMSRQELKEEFKQSEGDPHIKAKLRQIREERSRKRMMQSVPKADVIIRNPTHYAIALEYKQESMIAPVVVAMGQDLVALSIIKIGEENKIPVITNRSLARAMYESCDLDEQIPVEHYKAVAEIIAEIYKMKLGKVA